MTVLRSGRFSRREHVGHGVPHPLRVTRIVDRSRKPVGQSQTPLGGGQKHNAAIRCDASAIKRSCDLLASDGWKTQRRQRIVGHGGCGSRDLVEGLA